MEMDHIVQRLDMRRHIETNIKSQIVAWADFLADADRTILHAIFLHSQKMRMVAAARRVSTDSLRKYVRKLLGRVSSPEFQFIARHVDLLPPPTQLIARKCILQGLAIQDVARELRLATHYVRQQRRMAMPMLQMLVISTDANAAQAASKMGGAA